MGPAEGLGLTTVGDRLDVSQVVVGGSPLESSERTIFNSSFGVRVQSVNDLSGRALAGVPHSLRIEVVDIVVMEAQQGFPLKHEVAGLLLSQ